MNEFNFFGLKGNLKNVHDLISEEVAKKFVEEKDEKERNEESTKLSEVIKAKEVELAQATGTAEGNLKLAKEILDSWKKTIEEKDKIINTLVEENKKVMESPSTPTPSALISPEVSTSNTEEGGVAGGLMTTPTSVVGIPNSENIHE